MRHVLLDAGPSARGWSHQDILGRCPQAWAFQHVIPDPTLRPPADPLVKGSLVHVGLCHFWQDRLDGGDPERLDPLAAIDALAEREDAKLAALGLPGARWWAQHVGLAQMAMSAYIEADPHRHLRPLAVEHHVALWVDLVNGRAAFVPAPPDADARLTLAESGQHAELLRWGPPYLTSFRCDLLAADAGNRASIVDWKTGYRADVAKVRGFQAAGQFIQYQAWGSLAYREAWLGAFVGFVNLGDLRRGDRPEFDGWPVRPSAEAVARFPQAVWDRADRGRALLVSGRDPRDWPRAYSEQGPCSDRYAPCAHRDRCVGGAP